MTSQTRTSFERGTDQVLAVLNAVLFIGFPLLATRTLLNETSIEHHWPSFWLGVLVPILIGVTGVYSWMLWTGRCIGRPLAAKEHP